MNKIYQNLKSNPTLLLVVLVVLFTPQLASAGFIQETLWSIVNAVFGFFAYLGGQTLNYAVTNYVVGFGSLFESTGTGNSVNILWAVIRDIFNLTFIFGLVYIGLKMILDSSDSRARSMLVSLVLAALLVNFSLFITKFIIDFSNIAAAQFAAAFPMNNGLYQVSSSFMNILGFNDLFDAGSDLADVAGTSASYTYIFSTMFLYIILAFVFMAGGIMLIIRYMVLIIYMILSPIMFLGWVFPGLSSVSRDYWRKFLGRAFFAPAYLLMLYIANQVLVNMQGSNGFNAGSYGNVFSGDTDTIAQDFGAVVPFFLMTAGFLVASLVVAQKMGAEGANTALALGKRASAKVRSATTYIPRAVSRKGVNATGEWGEKKLNRIQTSKALGGWVAKAAKTNFVDRNVRGATTAAAGAQFGTGVTNKSNREYSRATQARANQTESEDLRAANFSTNTSALTDSTKTTAQLSTALDDLSKTIREMTKDEKNKIDYKDLTNKNVAANLSEDDIKNIAESGTYSTAEVDKIKDARKDGLVSIAAGGSTLANVDAAGRLTGFSHANAGNVAPGAPPVSLINKRQSTLRTGVQDIGKLPVEMFKEVQMYDHLTPAMVEERIKKGASDSDKIAMRRALESHLGIGLNVLPDTIPALSNNPWTKWQKGNSSHAADFFK